MRWRLTGGKGAALLLNREMKEGKWRLGKERESGEAEAYKCTEVSTSGVARETGLGSCVVFLPIVI